MNEQRDCSGDGDTEKTTMCFIVVPSVFLICFSLSLILINIDRKFFFLIFCVIISQPALLFRTLYGTFGGVETKCQ